MLKSSDSKNERIVEYFNDYKDRIPKKFFPVATNAEGRLILIGINDTGYGVITGFTKMKLTKAIHQEWIICI